MDNDNLPAQWHEAITNLKRKLASTPSPLEGESNQRTTADQATIAPSIVYTADDAQSAQYAVYLEGNVDEYHPFHVAEHSEPVSFETVAQYVAGTAQKVWDICHAFFHQEDEISNAQLAEAILYDTCSYTEQQKFERILASPEESASFFDNPTVQKNIAKAISKVKFRTDRKVWQAIANNLGVFTDPTAQVIIAWAIRERKFGTGRNVLQAIANNLGVSTDPKEQREIAWAIKKGKFDTEPDVLQAIANNLGVFTDPTAQKDIASAIEYGKFGTDRNVLQAIANSLGVFTDPQAQRMIAWAIEEGKFGTDLNVLQTIANNLGVFTDPTAQRGIAWAIKEGKFGTDHDVLQAIANNLGVFTDPEAQRMVALAIRLGKFGTDHDVLQAIANNLGVFTDPIAQKNIALQILLKKFGNDSHVLRTVFNTTIGVLAYQEAAISLMPNLVLTLEEKIPILRQMKFSLELPAVGSIPEENLPNLFGAKAYSGNDVINLLKTRFPTISEGAIKSVCDDNQQYALQLNGNQLILYPLTTDQAEFKDWITSDNSVFYKHCVTNVIIFDFANLKDGYPTIVKGKDLSPSHTLFATLPGYLKHAIRDNHFNPDEFKHAETIKFVTQTLLEPLMQKDRDLATKMQSIMQSSIVAGGNYVTIAVRHDQDVSIKDAINALCQNVENTTNFNATSKTFFNGLPTIDDKARLAVLFGTMAKRGVLGYEYGNKNQANNLLYSLAKACFDNLKGANNIAFPVDFHDDLANGICIEQLTNRFIIANSSRIDFHDVFALSAGV